MQNDLINTASSRAVHGTNSESTRATPEVEDDQSFQKVLHGEVHEPWRVTVDSAGILCFNSHNGDGTYSTCLSIAPRDKAAEQAAAARRRQIADDMLSWQEWWASLLAPWRILLGLERYRID
jgi:hypothetical protein